jgi:hypothetical protein
MVEFDDDGRGIADNMADSQEEEDTLLKRSHSDPSVF